LDLDLVIAASVLGQIMEIAGLGNVDRGAVPKSRVVASSVSDRDWSKTTLPPKKIASSSRMR